MFESHVYKDHLIIPASNSFLLRTSCLSKVGDIAVFYRFSSYLDQLPFPNLTVKIVEMVAADIDQYLPKPYAGEMRGRVVTRFNVQTANWMALLHARDTKTLLPTASSAPL